MARRTVKTFTVEVRSLGEKRRKRARPKLARPQPSEALSVIPEQPEPSVAVPAGVTLTGRVLPALDEPKHGLQLQEQPAKRRGRPRKTAADAWAEDEARDRLEEPETASAAAHVAPKAGLAGLSDPESGAPLHANARAVGATVLLRRGRKRLPRSAFKRGERWKTRLRAAVHRAAVHRAAKRRGA